MDASLSPSAPYDPARSSGGNCGSAASGFLRQYFASGWAFLVPYLLAYLLYYRLKWPVNVSLSHVPPLLHIYWYLHGLNLLLGALALREWWHDLSIFPASACLCWFFLALVFFIPGTYLEFPSDPWDHYRRINEWKSLLEVGSHPVWFKSSYFFYYSLLGGISATRQIFWLDALYTGVCLLLCRQYFQLARTVGLGDRAAFIFVLIQTLLFGNSIFSFYRYYGIASTILAQIGAIALIRIGMENAGKKPILPSLRLFPLSLSVVSLLLLIACNHVQGLGIAALGLFAVAIWRMVEWKRATCWYLAALGVILSFAAIRWWPRHPALDAAYRPFGVLTSWYGFNLLSFHSLSGDRMLQILGFFGVVNLAVGVVLIFRNHVVGWLTITPVLALSLPFLAIPIAGALAHNNWNDIIAFHRMFLAIPAGLAITCIVQALNRHMASIKSSIIFNLQHSVLLLVVLLILTTVPAAGPFYNRFWNLVMKPPEDLTMLPLWTGFSAYSHARQDDSHEIFAATSQLSWVLATQTPVPLLCSVGRTYYNNDCVPSADLDLIRNTVGRIDARKSIVVVLGTPTSTYTAYSIAALCSHHWLPQEAAFAFSGSRELRATMSALNFRSFKSPQPVYFFTDQASLDR
jgi:hypothetical protein